MTEPLFRRVAPALAVYSGRQFIDPQHAPREVLQALPSISADQVASIIGSRARREAGIIPPVISIAGRAFAIRVQMQMSGTAVVRHAVVRLTDNPLQPYWVLDWRAQ